MLSHLPRQPLPKPGRAITVAWPRKRLLSQHPPLKHSAADRQPQEAPWENRTFVSFSHPHGKDTRQVMGPLIWLFSRQRGKGLQHGSKNS